MIADLTGDVPTAKGPTAAADNSQNSTSPRGSGSSCRQTQKFTAWKFHRHVFAPKLPRMPMTSSLPFSRKFVSSRFQHGTKKKTLPLFLTKGTRVAIGTSRSEAPIGWQVGFSEVDWTKYDRCEP